jgi:type I restriction-modification system DNA methylase subunit
MGADMVKYTANRDKMLKAYLKEIFEVTNRGDAREESHYSTLEELLNQYAESIGKREILITTLPKKTEAGNPDFRIWDGKQHIVGYIEAKAPTIDNLDVIEDSEQLQRYRNTFANLILTNFFEFRLYRNGALIDKVSIGRPFIVHKLKTTPPVENADDFFRLLEKFFSFSFPKVYDAKTLAIELAKRTRFLRDEVVAQELKEEAAAKGSIWGFYQAFKEYLIMNLSQEDFADLYSQTITYGLFAARTRSENGFNRKLAYDNIPHTIGILREVFRFISLEDLPKPMEWIIDDISEVLAVTDVKNILHQYFHEGKGKDPVVHFYETFLAEYDPKTRERRGVYYTPEPVVSYIVRSLHHILKEHFNKPDGFASEGVTVLDPAAGTLTFLAEASNLAVNEFVSKYGEGGKENFIKEHILKNFYAFELMMAPYAVGHLKMSFLLEELGYKLQQDDRFKLYLTNTLEMEELAQTELPGMVSLSEESHLAGKVKKEQPILVILGNPPYSVSSTNKSDFIEKEMNIYKEAVRKERNIQPLSDDYIKFIRFAHWKIDTAGQGIIGMITNNSYLSGLIHRGMRQRLLESFNEIYITNLHGNSRIGEKCPDGSKDENVFDIQQGVSIVIFIKTKEPKGMGKVYYQDVYGAREKKYQYLNKYELKLTKWKKLQPSEPHYFFIEKDFSSHEVYDKFISIIKIFDRFTSGVKTRRDNFMVAFTKEEVKQRIRTFTSDLPDEMVKKALNLKDTTDWKLNIAREKAKKIDWREYIKKYSYRPFDTRYVFYFPDIIERGDSRIDAMKNLFEDNLGLVFMRQYLYYPVKIYNYAFCINHIFDIRMFISNRGSAVFSPLYLYHDPDKKDMFSHTENPAEKKPNINDKLLTVLSEVYKKNPTPEEIFYYIYGVLYSNIYRTKYAEFLKIDFPRIPFTKDYELFTKMAEYGKRLVDLHLLTSSELDPPLARFQGEGNEKVEKLRYNENEERVYINPNRYFEGIPQEVWQYQIGGYQVCDKWLKDRKGRTLSLDDIKHYCKIVTSLQHTIRLQKAIDDLYPEVEKNPIEFENKKDA